MRKKTTEITLKAFTIATILTVAMTFQIPLKTIPKDPNFEPILLAELSRHGARTSIKYPKEDYVLKLGPGNLTGNGQRMHFLLGQQLKKNYPNLFNITADKYRNEAYLLYSSGVPRTIESAYSQLVGLFPPGPQSGDQVSTNQLTQAWTMTPPFQNFSIDLINKTKSALPGGYRAAPVINAANNDTLFNQVMERDCPNAFKLKSTTKKTQYKANNFKANETIQRVLKAGFSPSIFGLESWTLQSLTKLYDHWVSYLYYFGKFPKGVDEKLYTEFVYMKAWTKLFELTNVDYSKFYTTKISEELLTIFDEKTSGGKPHLRFLFFSGHDSTIAPFLHHQKAMTVDCTLKRYSDYLKNRTLDKITTESTENDGGRDASQECAVNPPFASNYLWELNQKKGTNEYYVRVIYNGEVLNFCPEGSKTAPGGFCLYKDFKKQMTQINILSTADWNKVCFGTKEKEKESAVIFLGGSKSWFWVMVCSGFTTLFWAWVAVRLYRRLYHEDGKEIIMVTAYSTASSYQKL